MTAALRAAARAPDPIAAATQPDLHPDPAARLLTLRGEIDALDGDLLDLLQRRIALARAVGAAKPPPADGEGREVAFRPDREVAVLGRLLARAEPELRPLVEGVWREVMGAGLAAQGPMTIAVWRGPERRTGVDAARRRFGASATYTRLPDAAGGLAAAACGDTVAVLALEGATPWWTALVDPASAALWVCEAMSAADDPHEPDALAVARLPPASLAPGREVRVVPAGGDGGWNGPAARVLAEADGLRLLLAARPTEGPLGPADRERGVVGRV